MVRDDDNGVNPSVIGDNFRRGFDANHFEDNIEDRLIVRFFVHLEGIGYIGKKGAQDEKHLLQIMLL